MTTESKTEFATFSTTIDAVNALNIWEHGFATFTAAVDALNALDMEKHGLSLQLYSLDVKTNEFSLDYKTETGSCEAIGHIYECCNGRSHVSVHRDPWQDPVAWSGTRTSRDASTDADALAEFAAHIRRELINEYN